MKGVFEDRLCPTPYFSMSRCRSEQHSFFLAIHTHRQHAHSIWKWLKSVLGLSHSCQQDIEMAVAVPITRLCCGHFRIRAHSNITHTVHPEILWLELILPLTFACSPRCFESHTLTTDTCCRFRYMVSDEAYLERMVWKSRGQPHQSRELTTRRAQQGRKGQTQSWRRVFCARGATQPDATKSSKQMRLHGKLV
jgi:hypothetical protein